MEYPDKFDYSSVAEADREGLKKLSDGIRTLRLGTANVIDLGTHLISAKKIVGGSFGRYCNEAVQLEKRSAQNYMTVARLAQQFDRADVEKLPVATAEQLARKSCPRKLRQEIFDEVRAGKIPTKEEVKSRIDQARGKSTHKVTNEEADRLVQKLRENLDPSSLAELGTFLMNSSLTGVKHFAIDLQSGGPERRQPLLLEYRASA
jgi:hypothetical protein